MCHAAPRYPDGGTRTGVAVALELTEASWPIDTSVEVLDVTVGDVLRGAAEEVPGGPALTAGVPESSERRRWTYAELLADSEQVARALLTRFEPGERVAIWAPNEPEWVLLELGAALAGVVLVTVNPALRAQEVSYILRQSRASGLFHTDEFRGYPMASVVDEIAPALPELRHAIPLTEWGDFAALGAVPAGTVAPDLPSVAPDDPAQVQYTSGTTGFPKGALLRHRGIANNARFTAERCEVPEGAGWVNPMPLFHTGGCVLGALGAIWRRAHHVLVHHFDPTLVLELVHEHRPYIMGGVPTMLIAMMEHPRFAEFDLSSLEAVISGGASVPPELVRRIESSLGVRFSIVYGQTETSPVITQTRLDDSPDDKALTVGRPLPQTGCRVVDPATGEVVPIGTDGEICTRGYLTMEGYFEMPEATADTIDADGWLHTGDLGRMDARGYVTVTGRLKDLVIRGGENVYPAEIEQALFEHPAVGDAAVLGLPDDRWGEVIAAVVRPLDPQAPPAAADLHAWCRERLAAHKAPQHWFVADAFPLTGSGKVQKFVLREQAEKGALERLA